MSSRRTAEPLEEMARRRWREADAVCFDVDSTVCRDEAIDSLAAFLEVGERVAAVTADAMNGRLSFRQALEQRLAVISPSLPQLDLYKRQQPPQLTPGMCRLFAALHKRDVQVHLVSGGFRQLILPVAHELGVPEERVHANVLLFESESGRFADFDRSQPTSDNGGKALVCAALKRRFGYRCLVMVGDGATDLEAWPAAADSFVGFGANQCRDVVRRKAPWFVMHADELTNELFKRC